MYHLIWFFHCKSFPFSSFFINNTTLIPIPNSCLTDLPIPSSPLINPKPLWVPERLAKSLVHKDLQKKS